MYAADRDPAAVACARDNLGSRVYQGDLYTALPTSLRGRVDVLLANVPYVASGAPRLAAAEARVYEPRAALDGGADGLDVFRRVAVGAPRWLAPGGVVLSEITESQADAASAVLRAAGLRAEVASDEDPGGDRGGRAPVRRSADRQPCDKVGGPAKEGTGWRCCAGWPVRGSRARSSGGCAAPG
jgi:methylase of polypeptide subunit release factors